MSKSILQSFKTWILIFLILGHSNAYGVPMAAGAAVAIGGEVVYFATGGAVDFTLTTVLPIAADIAGLQEATGVSDLQWEAGEQTFNIGVAAGMGGAAAGPPGAVVGAALGTVGSLITVSVEQTVTHGWDFWWEFTPDNAGLRGYFKHGRAMLDSWGQMAADALGSMIGGQSVSDCCTQKQKFVPKGRGGGFPYNPWKPKKTQPKRSSIFPSSCSSAVLKRPQVSPKQNHHLFPNRSERF